MYNIDPSHVLIASMFLGGLLALAQPTPGALCANAVAITASALIVLNGTPLDLTNLKPLARGAAVQATTDLSMLDMISRAERISGALPRPRGIEAMTDRMPNTALFAPVAFRLSQIDMPSYLIAKPIQVLPQLQAPSVSAVRARFQSTFEAVTKRFKEMLL